MTVPETYRLLTGKETLSLAEYKLSAILGWCTELVGCLFRFQVDITITSFQYIASSNVPRRR